MSKEYEFDESPLLDRIDNMLENMDPEYLLQAREELIKEGKDTEIIDKALAKQQEQKQKPPGLLDLLFGMSTKKNKETISKENDYEPYNFEEEDLEEDDYYYEDD